MGRRKDQKVHRRKDWACPYFTWDGDVFVMCQAGRPTFPNRTYANDYMDRHCADVKGWCQCTLAQTWNTYNEIVGWMDAERTQGKHGE